MACSKGVRNKRSCIDTFLLSVGSVQWTFLKKTDSFSAINIGFLAYLSDGAHITILFPAMYRLQATRIAALTVTK